jgi:hypothetical protein
MDELNVEPGLAVTLTARHDTYGISFVIDPSEHEALLPRRTPVPLFVSGP